MSEVFDSRIVRTIKLYGGTNTGDKILPYITAGRLVNSYLPTPQSAADAPYVMYDGDDSEESQAALKKRAEFALERANKLSEKWAELKDDNNFVGAYSMIHPYALVSLAGINKISSKSSSDNTNITDKREYVTSPLIDSPGQRWYEVDGTPDSGHYSKNPTTTSIINWAEQDKRKRFTYAFTDFVFCKYWNKIQNNRMITLRRYPLPITDNVEPAEYTDDGYRVDAPFAPLATAITYFGEGTGNSLKDILKFTVGYEWRDITADVWDTTSAQSDGSDILGSGQGQWLSSGLKQITQFLGIFNEFKAQRNGGSTIDPLDAAGLPPDPYAENGMYANRIIGPINVISSVKGRKRGLKFTGEGLTLVFDYVSRPIANVNNKAIILDLLSNILLMTSASGTFFGGAHKYRNENPKIYPWKNTDILSNLYKGRLFGQKSVYSSLVKETTKVNSSLLQDIVGEMWEDAKNFAKRLAANAVQLFKNIFSGKGITTEGADTNNTGVSKTGTAVQHTAQKVISAHLLKGATVPWLHGARAILTGEPVGDWHLVIGNPMNPIAMIGNLVVDSCDIEFSDELGPDDFPIGFKATIKLMHGMGRDKDGVESMFNRGEGRIYNLSDSFASSADGETRVDANTGTHEAATTLAGGKSYVLQPSGSYSLSDVSKSNTKLQNSGTAFKGVRNSYKLDLNTITEETAGQNVNYEIKAWHAHMCL